MLHWHIRLAAQLLQSWIEWTREKAVVTLEEPPFSLEANRIHIAGVHPPSVSYVVKLHCACRLQFPRRSVYKFYLASVTALAHLFSAVYYTLQYCALKVDRKKARSTVYNHIALYYWPWHNLIRAPDMCVCVCVCVCVCMYVGNSNRFCAWRHASPYPCEVPCNCQVKHANSGVQISSHAIHTYSRSNVTLIRTWL
jgi:hypothetical protein